MPPSLARWEACRYVAAASLAASQRCFPAAGSKLRGGVRLRPMGYTDFKEAITGSRAARMAGNKLPTTPTSSAKIIP